MTTTTTAAPAVEGGLLSQLLYYAGWVLMLLVESALWVGLGVVVGLVAFTIGGAAWGCWQASQTEAGERLRGPVLRATRRFMGHGTIGFVAAVLLGGPPGVAAASASLDRSDTRRLIIAASVLYALVWATFHVVRPQGDVPMHVWPSLP